MRVRGFDQIGGSLGIRRRVGVARAGGSFHAIGPARDATPGGWGPPRARTTRTGRARVDARARARAREVSGRTPEYHHSGLCGGAALRARTLAEGRVPNLAALKRLDDRVDRWHDVALAAFFMFNGARTRPWDDARENGHPPPDFGPTAFERLGKDEANAAPLAAEDARLYRRVDPETHRGYAPDADAVYDPAKARGGAAENGGERPSRLAPRRTPPRLPNASRRRRRSRGTRRRFARWTRTIRRSRGGPEK